LKYRKLGSTNLLVSEIGFGTWGISGIGYGSSDDNESLRTLHKALDLGINLIDTADSYGNGHSEELIGRVLKERGDKDTIIATKFGWDLYRPDGIRCNLKRDYISFAIERSLKRLGRDWIDIYQVHNSKPDLIIKNKVYETLDDLKNQGKIRFCGVSASRVDDGIEAISSGKSDVIQVRYNLLDQKAAKTLFPLAIQNRTGIIVREPLFSGLLTGKYDSRSRFPKNDHRRGWSRNFLEETVKKVKKLEFLKSPEKTMSQAALSFTLLHKAVSSVIPGLKTVKQLYENLEGSSVKLDSFELEEIKSLYTSNFQE
jgi:aryl-alcohol dehydrogenase-like predicted oxidoreductase